MLAEGAPTRAERLSIGTWTDRKMIKISEPWTIRTSVLTIDGDTDLILDHRVWVYSYVLPFQTSDPTTHATIEKSLWNVSIRRVL